MTTFKVDGMTCGHCTAAIEQAIRATDPGARVAFDLAAREVRVEGALDTATLATAIRGAGYEPRAL